MSINIYNWSNRKKISISNNIKTQISRVPTDFFQYQNKHDLLEYPFPNIPCQNAG
jgi:hypothetical protein